MANVQHLHQHLVNQFRNYSVHELITLNNDIVSNQGWGTSKATFRSAVLNSLAHKGLDLSSIISKEDGFTTIKIVQIKLSKANSIVPLDSKFD